jgi:hypothetical protein
MHRFDVIYQKSKRVQKKDGQSGEVKSVLKLQFLCCLARLSISVSINQGGFVIGI